MKTCVFLQHQAIFFAVSLIISFPPFALLYFSRTSNSQMLDLLNWSSLFLNFSKSYTFYFFVFFFSILWVINVFSMGVSSSGWHLGPSCLVLLDFWMSVVPWLFINSSCDWRTRLVIFLMFVIICNNKKNSNNSKHISKMHVLTH